MDGWIRSLNISEIGTGGFLLSDLSICLDEFKIRSMGLGCEVGFLSYGLTVLKREWGALEARVDSAATPIGCRLFLSLKFIGVGYHL